MINRTAILLGLVALASSGGTAESVAQVPHQPIQVAVTIDDLPWVGSVHEGETRLSATRRLLAALKRGEVPAVGFVNCQRVRPDAAVLRMWLDAGLKLGNHTATHPDLNTADTAEWVDDAARCHTLLTELQGHPPEYFRYPFLHEGPTVSRQQRAREGLDRLGYTNATVTIDNSEFMLASYYARAVDQGDSARADAVVRAYVQHLTEALAHFDRVAQETFGRRIPQVLLLHANLLAADHLDEVLQAYDAAGVEFISLERALSDSVFQRESDYVGPKGLSWIYRADGAAREKWASWDDEQASMLRSRFRETGPQ
jgi:peptidoglycan/xylan/chitin deacetylase (PgdA/CDA1 family)